MIEIKNVFAGYGKFNVLNGVSTSFQKGKLTAIIGPNGSGKSTLLKTMVGILPINSGEMVIDGKSIADTKQRDIAKKAAYLPQGKRTPDMTVEQLVLHGRFPHLNYPRRYTDCDRQIAKNAMRKARVEQFSNRYMSTLSGGMCQKAYIAMALSQGTDYILMDEPTTYLDIAHQIELMKMLRELSLDGKGIVAVIHDLPLAFTFFDEIAVVENGKIIAKDTPQNICNKTVISDVFQVQLKALNGDMGYTYNGFSKSKQ